MKMQWVLMLALLGAISSATADIYKWVDAKGNVHYSDKPVEGAKRVSAVDSHPSDPAVIAERTETAKEQREKAAAASQKQQANEEASKNVEKDMEKLAAERCKEAQEAYKTATESQRLYRMGKNGEREYLTDEEISTARINARKTLDEACAKKP